MSSGRGGNAIVLTCFFTAGQKIGGGFWHSRLWPAQEQWVKSYISNLCSCETAQRPFEGFLLNSQDNIQTLHHTIGDIYIYLQVTVLCSFYFPAFFKPTNDPIESVSYNSSTHKHMKLQTIPASK